MVAVNIGKPNLAYATASSTINFQARLKSNTGAIVPDGDYNVAFKIYDTDTSSGSTDTSCSGDVHCLWVESRTSGAKVTVANGYLSVQLGSANAFGAGIDWSQQLYLTMNIGGTGSASWDGEMDPRLPLTAVPYSFLASRAATADQLSTTNGTGTSTLAIQAPTGGAQTFVIQNQGAGGTYNILTAPSGSDGYIKLQGGSPGSAQTGNFNISGTGIAGALSADTFDAKTSSGTLSIGNANAAQLELMTNNAAHIINIGTGAAAQTIIIGSNNSTSSLDLAAGSGGIDFYVSGGKMGSFDTNGMFQLGIQNTWDARIQFNNASNTNTVLLQSGATSGSYTIKLPTAIGTAGQCLTISSVASTTANLGWGSCGGGGGDVLQGGNAFGAIMQLGTTDTYGLELITDGNAQATIAVGGAAVFKNSSDSDSAFQIQNSGTTPIFNVNSNTGQITIAGTSNTNEVVVKRYSSQDLNKATILFTDSSGSTEIGRLNMNDNNDMFLGYLAGSSVSGGYGSNVGIGATALQALTTGGQNVAIGNITLQSLETGSQNVAIGSGSSSGITGDGNVSIGATSLGGVTNGGWNNVAIGTGAGNVAGADGQNFYDNTFLGYTAGSEDNEGFVSSQDLQRSTAVGSFSQVQANNTIVLGRSDNFQSRIVIGTTMPFGSNIFGVSPKVYHAGTACQGANTSCNSNGTMVTGTSTSWQSDGSVKVGMHLIFADGTDGGTITAIVDDDTLTVDTSQTVADQNYRIHNPGFQITDTGDVYVASTSTTAFRIQSANLVNLMSADTTNSVIKVSGIDADTFAIFQVDNGHFKSTQNTAPSIGVGTCTGTPTVTSGSTDSAGSFSLAASSAAQCVITVTFHESYGAAPKSVVISPKNSNANAVQAYVSSTTSSTFVVTFGANSAGSTTYDFYYWVIE